MLQNYNGDCADRGREYPLTGEKSKTKSGLLLAQGLSSAGDGEGSELRLGEVYTGIKFLMVLVGEGSAGICCS